MKIKLACASLAALLLTNCATVISSTTQVVTIDSNVKGANVTLDGNQVGVTPFAGKIPRKREMLAVVSKEGYQSAPINLTTTFNPVAVINVFWDWSTTDCITGACWEYAPNSYYVNLKAEEKTSGQFRAESELKAFAMTFHADLQREIAVQGGARLDSMQARFFPAITDRRDFVAQVSALERDSAGDAVRFGEGVAALQASRL